MPTSSSSPDLWELVLIGAGIGLAAGAGVALALVLARRQSDRVDDQPAAEALLDRLEQRLAARESALAARERDLQARIDELRALESGAAASRD